MSAAVAMYGISGRCKWVAVFLPLAAITALAGDWPQYRGANHDGTSADRLNKNWSGSVTNPVWLIPSSNALNSICSLAVSGGRTFTQTRRNIDGVDKDVCIALSITNGAELWAAIIEDSSYPEGGIGYDDGPRTTPAVDGGSVFVLSSYLNLFRFNATNGSVIWQKDLRAIYGGDIIGYENCASPVIEGGLIYLNANCGISTLMGLRTSDGELAWRSQDEALTHSTPVLATIHGVRQVIFATQSGLVSLDAQTGAFLWKSVYPFFYSTSLGCSPVVWDDMVFVTAALDYGEGSVVVQASFTNSAWTTTQLWHTNNPSAHWMTPVAYQGFLYGQFGIQFYDSQHAQLKCIDMRTGAVKWSVDEFGRGATILVDSQLVSLTERGELVLVKPDTNSYVELGRFLAIPNYWGDTNKCWNGPAVADGRAYVRSTSFAACYDLSMAGLKLDPPRPVPANKLQLTVRTADGTAIDSNRLTGMELRSSTNLNQSPSLWPKLTNTLTLTNGLVRATNVDAGTAGRAFFIITEPN